MIRRFSLSGIPALAVLLLVAGSSTAQQDLESRVSELERRNSELEGRLSALADEQEGLALAGLMPPAGESHYGLGPSASKVYESEGGVSIGGYGEWLYRTRNGMTPDTLDMLRVVLYVGYHFSPNWVFNSELEWEHAGEEVGVEFATLDYLWREAMNFRAGLVLVPMGFVNELHEPTTLLGATRGLVERQLLPSTWREPGVGVFGDAGPFSYRAYVIDGFDATGFTAEGLRGGRQEGMEALAEDLAVVGRLDWTATPGLLVGGSLYRGDAGQSQAGLGATGVTLAELHGEWRANGLWIRALAARGEVDDVAALNAAGGLTGAESVGEELAGAYVEAGYDLLDLFAPGSEQSLMPYARFETLDTQREVPAGFASDPANDTEVTSFGLRYAPLRGLVFKAEFQDFENGADGMNVTAGYAF